MCVMMRLCVHVRVCVYVCVYIYLYIFIYRYIYVCVLVIIVSVFPEDLSTLLLGGDCCQSVSSVTNNFSVVSINAGEISDASIQSDDKTV